MASLTSLTDTSMASPSSLSLLSLSLFILLSSYPIISAAADTLSSGNSLATNQTLTSVGKKFVLGFFTPGNSSNHYIGIWYSQIDVPEKTIVWVANRETPLKDPAGVFTISGDGNLVILDGKKSVVWSANISTGAQRNTSAVLSDSGNFVLTDDSGTVLWESFNNPTDTYLPGMKFRLNRQTRETNNLVSWKSSDDPSTGKLSLGIDPIIPLQIVMWSGSDPIWRSGRWTGDIFGGSLKTDRNFISYLTVIATEKEISFTVAVSDTIVSRLVLTEAGRIQQLSLISQKWQVIWWKPKSPCEFYNRCGISGVCDEYSVPKVCKCLRGHEPKVQREWEAGNNSAGCVRRTSLGCNEGDGFFKMGKIKVPDLSTVVGNVSQDECQDRCLRNCSCGAYAYDDLTGVGCIVWGVDLLDVEENYATGLDFYVRLPRSELGMVQEKDGKGSSNGKKRLLSILLPILGAVILVACIFACFMRKRNKKQGKVKGSKLPEWAVNKVAIDLKDSNNLGEGGDNPELPLFSFSSVVAATNNFSPANKLGQGGFGPVYKGRLPEGQEIAVKRLSKKSGQGIEEFRNELLVIAKLQHRNLVRLLGWSIHQEEKILIYEYMPNKSLDKFLFDPTKKGLLDWGTRFRIIEGIAQGLLYLHTYSRLKIIHRDMKSGNILLDSEMNPKISDFGMARIFEGDQTEANTNRVVGTYGYMSPEYALDGLFSEKSDVFSYGVLLLEIVSGKKNTGFYQSTENLVGQAWRLWSEGRSMELMDPSLGDMCVRQQVERCIHVGLLCIQEDAGDRPTMSLAVMMLGDENTTLPPPKQSGFTAGRAPPSNDAESDNHSVNEMSVSTITPR